MTGNLRWLWWRHQLWRLPFMDDLVIDSVQFVCPLVLIHSVFAPASDPNGFFQPVCGFVRFLIDISGGVPVDDVIIGRDVLSYGRFESLRRRYFPLWSGEIFGTLFICFFLVFWKSSFENAACFTYVGFGATFAWNFIHRVCSLQWVSLILWMNQHSAKSDVWLHGCWETVFLIHSW